MKLKLMTDTAMIAAMFFSMSFHLFGAGVHKMVGLLAFLLFILHNLLNRRWYRGLFRGKYSPLRITHTAVNLLVVLAMAGIMVSGVMLSKELAAGAGDAMTRGRILHNVSSYVCCAGMAFHIGFHLKRRAHHDD